MPTPKGKYSLFLAFCQLALTSHECSFKIQRNVKGQSKEIVQAECNWTIFKHSLLEIKGLNSHDLTNTMVLLKLIACS